MPPLVFALPGSEAAADRLAAALGEPGHLAVRRFPDGESYVRVLSDVAGRDVVLVGSLDRPDPKILPLLFAAETCRELGADRVVLVAPYLCYLRQDRAFHPGEAVAARLFAKILSRSIDGLVTVDPHLHRITDLSEVYGVPSRVVHAAPAIARWVAAHVDDPVFVGPDEESGQWVADVAARAGAPSVVLEKVRHGDRDVEVRVPASFGAWGTRTPVLVDDILSTGRTLAETIGHLSRAGARPPVCVAVHGLFAEGAAEALAATGATVVTCDTVPHPTNEIDVLGDVILATGELLNALARDGGPASPSATSRRRPRRARPR